MASYSKIRRGVLDLKDMSRIFFDAVPDVEQTFPEILNMLGEAVRDRAVSYLGVPQPPAHGGFPPWPPLSRGTLKNKGQAAPGTPLYETGKLAASIDYEILSENEVEVGTDVLSDRGAPYGKYLEEGTSRMPPRTYLHPAAVEVVAEMVDVIGEAVVDGIFQQG